MLSDVKVGWPWPYLDEELAAIRAALHKVPNADAALIAIVAEARRFLSPPAVAERATHIRPNSRTQVQRLASAVQEIKGALEALDLEAIEHLHLSASLPDEMPHTFQTAVCAFEYNPGLAEPPVADVMARKPNAHISALQLRIRKIVDDAFLPKRPPVRGWPAIRKACLNPIDPAPVADEKSRQDQLLSAKRREKSDDFD